MKKEKNIPEVSLKSTKEQILSAYNNMISKLSENQMISPQEEKKHQEKEEVVVKAASNSADMILNDLNNLKSKSIKQIDNLSEQLLAEFEKLDNLRKAIGIEQNHLQELYKISEAANSLSALLQVQEDQKKSFKEEMASLKEDLEEEIKTQRAAWQKQKEQLELEYKEKKEQFEKSRNREEDEYRYNLELKRRTETDEYNTKKVFLEKELTILKEDLLKREEEVSKREQDHIELKQQLEKYPEDMKQAISIAEEKLRSEMLESQDFSNQLKQKEYDGLLAIKEQKIIHLEDKVKNQEILIKELAEKADLAAQQAQQIACRALDTSAQRFVNFVGGSEKDKNQ